MSLDAVIHDMYNSICFRAGQRPDWQRQAQLFAPGARMVRITDDGVFEFDLPAYRANVEAFIDSGAMTEFWEGEIWRETHQIGELAHVLSAYESRTAPDGKVLHRGVNSIQLFQRDGRWWVSALLWRREGETIRIPDAPPARA